MPPTSLNNVEYLRVVLDSIPSLIFIVDADLRVLDANSSAQNYLDKKSDLMLKRLCGEVLHCIHQTEPGAGCGQTPFCKDCILRKAVTTVTTTSEPFRDRHKLRQHRDGKEVFAEFFVTASPLALDDEVLVLMVMEDVTELLALRHLVTMCSVCNSIRNEDGGWEKVHQYLRKKEHIDCSHGLCPSCLQEQYRNVEEIQHLIGAASVHRSGSA